MPVFVIILFLPPPWLQSVSASICSVLTEPLVSVSLPAEGEHWRPVDSQRSAQPGGHVHVHGSDRGGQRRGFSQAGGPR